MYMHVLVYMHNFKANILSEALKQQNFMCRRRRRMRRPLAIATALPL